MSKALFVGRFQPLHIGHMQDIKKAVQENDELIIVIGSAQYSHEPDNPFSKEERLEMIKRSLKPDNYKIICLDDVHDDYRWTSMLIDAAGQFDVAYSGNEKVRMLLADAGFRVEDVKMVEGISSTIIRNRIRNDEPWHDMVPAEVAAYIEEIKGVQRIKEVA